MCPCCSFVPACRAQHLLDDAADAAATDFAAQRMQRLLAHCLAGWTAAVLVRGSARAAACQLLERVWAGQLLADWRLAAQLSRPAKAQLLAAWRDAAAEQRVRGGTACQLPCMLLLICVLAEVVQCCCA